MSELVTFKTEDGIEIVGDFYASPGDRFAILLHMMPETKESWRAFAERLVEQGYSCLAIDMRGHGESNMAGALHYRTFSDAQHQAKMRDVEAAFAWLAAKGADETNTVIIGASIGANLGVSFAVEKGVPLAIALSPGLNYHGVSTTAAIRALKQGQEVLLVASDDDPESAEGCAILHSMNPTRAQLMLRSGVGHGTRMFNKDPNLMDELIELL